MGNYCEIDLTKYGCSCVNQEDGGFLDFVDNLKNKAKPFINTMLGEKEREKNLSKSNLSVFTTQTHSRNGLGTNKKYESITLFPHSSINDNININQIKEEKIRNNSDDNENENSLLNDKNYLKQFEYSETEINASNNTINSKRHNNNLEEELDKDEEEEDINNFNLNTDYYQLAIQIAQSINELKNNVFNCGQSPYSLNTPKDYNINGDTFENAIKRAGKVADTICFNDVIGCIKKISDIISEVTLKKERIYLAIVNKFKKKYSLTHFINFNDEERIVEIPNFDGIKYEMKKKLGKFNNAKFKFNKFILQGSFPNEILIWKLISQNMEKISHIIKDNYYCCAILLHKGKTEKENETIIYLINKLEK